MSTTNTKMFGNFLKNVLSSTVNLLNDDIRVILCTAAYAPNQDTHVYKDVSVTNEISGAGYTTGGTALTSKSLTYFGSTTTTTWAPSTTYVNGAIVRPSTVNGHIYLCIIPGTSGLSAPIFPATSGGTVIDGTITWKEVGTGFTSFSAANVTWSNSTITARYAIIYDNTPASNKPLIAYIDLINDQSSNNGNFTITWDQSGIFNYTNS